MQKVCNRVEGAKKLYYKTEGKIFAADGRFDIYGGKLSFFSYFNCFPSYKYNKYTVIEDISVKLLVSGHGSVRICESSLFETKVLAEEVFCFDKVTEVLLKVPLSEKKGAVLYPIIESTDGEKCTLYNFEYCTEQNITNDVNIAITICTYRREDFVRRNLNQFEDDGLNVPVFVIDNGRTLTDDDILYKNAILFRNKNYGGSGGFTRGMLESYKRRDKITHMLLMDDDISVESETIIKTKVFLSFLKEEYLDVAISGSMLVLDNPCIQHESGAVWGKYHISAVNHNIDLSDEKNILINESDTKLDYGAWWYMCMPVSVIDNNRLPLPFFIKTDDIEYGYRSLKTVVTVSGISVWHESFTKKYSCYLDYYIKRNELVASALRKENGFIYALRTLFASVGRYLLTYNYSGFDFLEMAIKDFMEGPDFFLRTDEEQLNNTLRSMEKNLLSIEELKEKGYAPDNGYKYDAGDRCGIKMPGFINLITLNGYLLPGCFFKKGYSCALFSESEYDNFFRYKTVIKYNPHEKKGIISYMERKQLLRGIKIILKYGTKIIFNYNRIRKEYREREIEITSVEFWTKHLGI